MKTLTADDFRMRYDADHVFEFVESEDATIMAWGHRDPDELLDEVFVYDGLCDPGYAERGTPADIRHLWAVRIEDADDVDGADGWWIAWTDHAGRPITQSTAGAFAVTVWAR